MLGDLATKFGTDKGPAGHNYTPHYERHLGYLTSRPCTLYEVGVYGGASLRMWEEWLPQAFVVGVDIDLSISQVRSGGRIRTVEADATTYDPGVPLDVVVDDGSHVASEIVQSHALLWPLVTPGGWYVIEDLDVHQDPQSPVFVLVDAALRELAHERGDVSEVHIYPQLVFLRRATP